MTKTGSIMVTREDIFYMKTSEGYEVTDINTSTFPLRNDEEFPSDYWISETHQVVYS